jgi:hypothetical protein
LKEIKSGGTIKPTIDCWMMNDGKRGKLSLAPDDLFATYRLLHLSLKDKIRRILNDMNVGIERYINARRDNSGTEDKWILVDNYTVRSEDGDLHFSVGLNLEHPSWPPRFWSRDRNAGEWGDPQFSDFKDFMDNDGRIKIVLRAIEAMTAMTR